MIPLKLTVAASNDELSVRDFSVREGISTLFAVNVTVFSSNPSIEPHTIVGKAATLEVASGYEFALHAGARAWTGVCVGMSQQAGDGESEMNRYALRIRPSFWLLTQRVNRRIFQRQSVPEIVDTVLSEWKLEPVWKIDRAAYPKRDFRLQYGESDYTFVARLLEEEGIAYYFEEHPQRGSILTFGDDITKGEMRSKEPLPFFDNPSGGGRRECLTNVELGFEVRPGGYTLTDHDFRRPTLAMRGEAQPLKGLEALLEQHDYQPGSMQLLDDKAASDTPHADNKGKVRMRRERGKTIAQMRLDSLRTNREGIHFATNAINLGPVTKFSMDHPHPSFGKRPLMTTSFEVFGELNGEWGGRGYAVFADEVYRPPLTLFPQKVAGPQSATVVGPKGDEIHCDEFGRVRVLFPWDRAGKANDGASCWVRVSQGWGGTGYGMMHVPRVGQEVLVAFEDGQPDRPVIMGRGYNGTNPPPYTLPKNNTISTWRSKVSPKGSGFNELMMQDAKDAELLAWHAEKDLRKLIKNDEASTVGRDRDVLVKQDLEQTIDHQRTQVQQGRRAELSDKERTTIVAKDDRALIKSNRHQRWESQHHQRVGSQQHAVGKDARVRIEGDSHLLSQDARQVTVAGKYSQQAQQQHLKVANVAALGTGLELHLKSGGKVVAEAGASVTLKAGASFVKIDASGVTVNGPLVLINSGGVAGAGSGASPKDPKLPKEAKVPKPPKRLTEVRAKAKEHNVPVPELRQWPKEKEVPTARITPQQRDGAKSEQDKKLTWIAIELVDEEGNPVAGEQWEVILPDGRKRFGRTDKDGKARIDGIDPGTCKVTFPKLDRDVWRKG